MLSFQLFLLLLCFCLFILYLYLRFCLESLKKRTEKKVIPVCSSKTITPLKYNDTSPKAPQIQIIPVRTEIDEDDEDSFPCPLTSRITPVEDMR
jgi:hypothetical protein